MPFLVSNSVAPQETELVYTFDDLLNLILRLVDAFARGQRKTHAAIARLIVGTRQYEIAHAGESHECIRARAESDAQTAAAPTTP